MSADLRSTATRYALFGAACLGAALVLGSLVGIIARVTGASAGGLSTADLASTMVAGATLLLALLTARLAIYTHQAVAAAQREAAAADEALQASWRPLLVDLPPGRFFVDVPGLAGSMVPIDLVDTKMREESGGFDRHGARLEFTVSFRNVGVGPAIIQGAGMRAGTGPDGEPVGWNPEISTAVVAPDEATTLTFRLPNNREDLEPIREAIAQAAAFVVEVGYTDLEGRRTWRTQAHVHHVRDERWRTRQVALYLGRSTTPLVMSGPGD